MSYVRIKELSDKLHALLQDPQPGLMAWNFAVSDVVETIAKERMEQNERL